MIDFEKLATNMGDLDEDAVVALLKQVMAEGGTDAQKALDACQKGMDIVGDRFESGEYFVGDLIFAGELMTEAVNILKDGLVTGEGGDSKKTKMILCTVKDDLHDIGKNIVRSMLEAAGFDVLDLGIDVAPETIVEKAKEDGKDFELIKRLGNSVHQDVKSAVIAFVVAALVIAMSVVYLYFYLTQKAQVEKYLVIAVGIATFILGIASMVSVLRKIRSTKDFLMEEKMKEQTPTYNDSDEVRNTDVRIIDISELKSKRTRRRKALPKPKAEEEGEKEELSSVSGDGLDGD